MAGLVTLNRLVLVAAGAALLVLAGHTYRRRDKPITESFAVLLGLLGITAFCTGVTATSGWPNKVIWLHTNLMIPVALLYFSFDYYGFVQFATRERLGALSVPLVVGSLGGTTLILGTAEPYTWEAPVVDALASLPSAVYGVATTFDQVGYYYTIFLIGLALVLVFRNVTRYQHLDTRLGVVIAFIGVWPWFGNLVVPELGQLAGLLALSTGYSISAVVALVVVGPLSLFGSSPAAGNVGPRRVLDSMDDPVVMIDDHEQILRLNRAATETFEGTKRDVVGQSLSAVLDTDRSALTDGEIVSLETSGGVRQFEITRSAVEDRWEDERGEVFVFTDVTGRLTREQRLEVLNRVLRHNLRNSASSIIARAELLREGNERADPDQIVEQTQSLIGTAERAREIEAMMTATTTDATTDLGAAVEAVVDRIGEEYPQVELTTALPDGAQAAVAPRVLDTVLRNLVENAAEHNDADQPLVVVSADRSDDGRLTIAVADNGPGIPEHERAVLDAGGEDQLDHGSGLGLWAAHWGVTQMGGDLSISENDPRGSVVSIAVPTPDEIPTQPPAVSEPA
jgi:PAS domain S-box-containing protein